MYRLICCCLLLIIIIVILAPVASYAQQDLTYEDPYFGVTIERPAGWYIEADNPWNHVHINPWHLPLIPIKELQPTAVDILLEGKKTMIASMEPADESGAYMRLSVERMPLGTTLDSYIEHSLARLRDSNENLQVDEKTETTLDGNPAILLVVTAGGGSYAAKTAHIISIYGNLAYILQYGAAVQDYDTNLPVFQRTVESADINPPASYANVVLFSMAGASAIIGAVIMVKVRRKESYTLRFLRETKKMLAPALGIEVLCVASAETGGLIGLYYFGFNAFGIAMAYILAYTLAGFATFASILGRSANAHGEEKDEIICGCRHESYAGFTANFKQTFANFAVGLCKMAKLHKEPDPSFTKSQTLGR